MGKARRKQQCRRLTQDPAHCEDTAGDNAVYTAGKHYGADDPPLSGSQTKRPLTIALGHCFQALLCRAHHGGQIHNDQRQRARKQTFAEIIGKSQHSHKAVYDRGNAGKGFGCIFDHADNAPVLGIFRQIDRRSHAQRQNDNKGRKHKIDRVHDIRQNTDPVLQVAGALGQ